MKKIKQRKYSDGTIVVVYFTSRYSGTVLLTNNPDRFQFGEYAFYSDSDGPYWTDVKTLLDEVG